MKLRHKMLIGSSLLAVLPVLVTATLVSGLSTRLAEGSLIEQAREQLTTIRSLKSQQIDSYFQLVQSQLQAYSHDPNVVEALTDFRDALTGQARTTATPELQAAVNAYYSNGFVRELRRRGGAAVEMQPYLSGVDNAALALQYHYIVKNPSPAGFKHELDYAVDGSGYSEVHAAHHPRVRDFVESAGRTSGYDDVLFIDANTGRVVYSLAKNLDFATSLEDGPYANSPLGDVFRRAKAAPSPDDVVFSDFHSYLPAFNAPAAFFASPVFKDGVRIGVIAVRISTARIDDIMTSGGAWRSVGLAETGETYLVGAESTMRSDSRFLVEQADAYLASLAATGLAPNLIERIKAVNSSTLLQPVNTPAVQAALAGRSGFQRTNDYRGTPVFTTYAPLPVLGETWAIIAQIDESEALAPVAALRNQVLAGSSAVGLGLLLLGGAAGWLFTRTITKPVQHLESTVRKIAAGDDSARARMTTGDELQTLGEAFDSLLDERIAQYEEKTRENEQLNNAVIQLLIAVSQLSQHDLTVRVPVTEDVTGPVADALNQMVSEIGDLLNEAGSVADQVGWAAQRVKEQADAVREMAAEEGVEVDAMAAELEAAARTMQEIAALAQRCDQAASRASETTGTALQTVNGTVQGMGVIRELVHETEKRIKRLGERSQEISGIVDIINTLAERTHVLALNAAMQAAAAGEAGRGFAVVADEVQRLAESSRNATSQISNLVHNIQIETSDTISTMGRTISEVVEGSRLAERAGEQMQLTQETTSELASAVQEIAGGSSRQADTSMQLREMAANVQLSTRKTREKLEEQTVQTHALVTSSAQLRQSIGAFKLPERKQAAEATEPRLGHG
ncbi:MAG TPA: methyl-accepting chemotaxis protein [Gammaproteobacteria bacterium]|nr:methyl-accepting chemotaxis protein [Gammaproteobacteria bacterium]